MIDQATIDKIMDTANILEVVSDFVTLRKRGVNYVGLCPFHDEKTPSFSVSPSKGICKCFSCGKGGSAVHFIMEHEQMSYYEALKYLAKKYSIEIQERELTDEEKQLRGERESMLIVNSFAQEYFSHILFDHAEGRSIGLAYFHEREFRDDIIRKFGLGYSLDQRNALAQEAQKRGYNQEYLLKTGLCLEGQNGHIHDRFKGRVIFPVYSLSGKVLAFGGRVLKKDDKTAKYVNSPESEIYHKSNELYGIFQAKQSIVKNDSCFLVEGYTDVLSMHQAGIENVVASSGTSLTPGQIRLIHRFTDNITVLYDGDAAGIKASLRGIDLILKEGMNIKVVLLPDGDDPDSFSKKQSAASFTEYIKSHETDFIRFKTNLLLESAGDDPIKRAGLISDIVRSISVIPDTIIRSVYTKECSRLMEIDEKILVSEINKLKQNELENSALSKNNSYSRPNNSRKTIGQNTGNAASPSASTPVTTPEGERETPPSPTLNELPAETHDTIYETAFENIVPKTLDNPLDKYERELIRYIIRYGYNDLFETEDINGTQRLMKVAEYIADDMKRDEIEFSNPLYKRIISIAAEQKESIAGILEQKQKEILEQQQRKLAETLEQKRREIPEMMLNKKAESDIQSKINKETAFLLRETASLYVERYFVSHPDPVISQLAVDLVSDKYQLSKVHTKYQKVETEIERLYDLIPRALFELKDAIISLQIKQLRENIKKASLANDMELLHQLMEQNTALYELKSTLAKCIGDRILNPK